MEANLTQDSDAVEVGPYCVGTPEGHTTVHPADFASQLREVGRWADEMWWRAVAENLRRVGARSGRLRPGLCQELAHAIDSGLQGILPASFAAAAKVNAGTHTRVAVPHHIRAVAYVLAKELGYVSDRAPAKRMRERFGFG